MDPLGYAIVLLWLLVIVAVVFILLPHPLYFVDIDKVNGLEQQTNVFIKPVIYSS
jgi:hypothetical protein